jgi:hypothetical protein
MLNKVNCLSIALLTITLSCKRDETFPSIGDKIASPIDVQASESGEYFYILNADFDRTYNKGSILVVDQDGNKIKSIEIPRLGRSLNVTDKDMLVTTDFPDDKSLAFVMLFDITDPKEPVLKQQFGINCSPINATIRKNYDYFFVTCGDGNLFIGKLEADRAASWIKNVRRFDATRRALYIDPKRDLLFAFTTDIGSQATADRESSDLATFNDVPEEVKNEAGESMPDEIPDDMQSTKREIAASSGKGIYQFTVYDIKAEKENAPECTVTATETCAFPMRTGTDPVIKTETRWIYFHLNNFDGTPDTLSALDPNFKYYRTNFFDAKPDSFDPDTFYLSHRGVPAKSGFANQIVKVQFVGDIRASAEGKVPHTGDVLTFERISGFKGEGQNGVSTTNLHFPGDFELTDINGQQVLVVNHFRDLASDAWNRNEVYFSITAKTLEENSWFTELPGSIKTPLKTFYQIAINKSGRALSCSFYGNAVILLEVTPGVGIREIKRIE